MADDFDTAFPTLTAPTWTSWTSWGPDARWPPASTSSARAT